MASSAISAAMGMASRRMEGKLSFVGIKGWQQASRARVAHAARYSWLPDAFKRAEEDVGDEAHRALHVGRIALDHVQADLHPGAHHGHGHEIRVVGRDPALGDRSLE